MADTQREVEAYVANVAFPTTREELINGLLSKEAPGRMVALVERLRDARYRSLQHLLDDLAEVSRVHAREVAAARTYDEFLAVVIRHVGDVGHATKDAYNRVVAHVVAIAEHQGTLEESAARALQQRLEGEFAGLRGTMTEVYDDKAPINPSDDLPKLSG